MNKMLGFSLIELVLTIVAGGVMAAAAVPHLADVSGAAQKEATASVAAVLASASVMNYTKEKAAAMSAMPIADCSDVAALYEGGVLPDGYDITAAAIPGEAGASVSCAVHEPRATVSSFRAIRVDPTPSSLPAP